MWTYIGQATRETSVYKVYGNFTGHSNCVSKLYIEALFVILSSSGP